MLSQLIGVIKISYPNYSFISATLFLSDHPQLNQSLEEDKQTKIKVKTFHETFIV